MAGYKDKMKQVFFLGAWRTQYVSEQLLRQISNQIASKKKVTTQLIISSEGLELLIYNAEGKVTRKDKIALENIVDLIDNKYSTKCLLAIVREKQERSYTVFVFLCKSDQDSAVLIHNFKTTKKQLSGEGYNTTLTPKGTNWTLQQKSGKSIHQTLNGDVKGKTVYRVPGNEVRVISTEKQNGGVTMINTGDRHDSFSHDSVKTSNSEVKEELHYLADEVRDIKRLLQGSKGRSQFEKHYGYRILQPSVPEGRPVEYTEKNVTMQPAELVQGNVYMTNESNVRYANGAPQVIRVGGGDPRSTRRFKNNVHYIRATSPTRKAYTKRVYDTKNPYEETGSVKIISRNTQPVLVPRQRLFRPMSQSSSIIHKNIEDVYKSRSVRRVYLPPPPVNGSTVEYVNSQIVQNGRQQALVKAQTPKENEQSAVHVKYSPEIRTYYEPKDSEHVVVESNSSNVSTNVSSTSVNNNINNNTRQIERDVNISQIESIHETEDNVIVVNALEENSQNTTTKTDGSTVYVQNSETNQRNVSRTVGGGVYYVRAERAEDYEKSVANDDHVTIIQSSTENQDDIIHNDGHEEINNEISTETALGDYTREEEFVIEKNEAEELQSSQEDGGLFGAYAKKVDENEELNTDIIKEKSYRYHDNDDDDDEEKTNDEKTDEVEKLENIEERRVHYNETVEHIPSVDIEQEHVEHVQDSNDVYEADKEDEGYSQDQFRHHLGAVVNSRVHNYDVKATDNDNNDKENKEVEDNGDNQKFDMDALKAEREKGGNSQDQFRHELSSVVSRIRHNYDTKAKENDSNDKENSGEDEKEDDYKFDMDALKAFSMEPNIILIEADTDKTVQSVNKPVVSETLEKEVSKYEYNDVEVSDLANNVEIQKDEQSKLTEDDVRELISKTEDSVLF